ncbi:hypothetical protein [Listeria seeligeri]|uniref:hypothetical protein n=1 Tax=Listeria seeligeri TaxID=1640 RepID=UPI001626A8BC|nr:hypothetical protein [Listeria seeligeri]MBC1719677.1 hypothetical protein [Listeria seeligeri]MBC1735030.1 hypothetical protein [Listeria seeligeri]MBC1857242.1 hypothetical protein [Listeria seeligeri]MBF2365975.1 hypothetical protein [Listeria seeligeri]MBF2539963.1 hypothetical protein [Listeria seeligeri]
MKKAFIPLLFLLFLLASCSAPNEKLTKNTKIFKEGVINADYQIPQNLAELESNSEDIVKVKLLQNKENGKNNSTISEVEIIEKYKGNFESGEKIDISEPWLLNTGEYQAVENYIALEKGREYILFLSGGHDGDRVSSITSLGYGKFNKTLKEQKASMNDFDTVGEVQKYDFISNSDEEVLKYQDIKKQVLERFN